MMISWQVSVKCVEGEVFFVCFVQKNYKGPKIIVYMCSWGKFWTRHKKDQKSSVATSEELGVKAKYCT